MNDAFQDREKGYEAKYKLDEERRFKVDARRNRLVGEWAAAKLGLAGDAVKDYVRDVVRADMAPKGAGDVVSKLAADFRNKNVTVGEPEIREEIARLNGVAVEQINAEYPSAL
jgi:hypothetical protein